jgi:hypothetical protein
MTRFQIGQRVKATASVQGMQAGLIYEVVDLTSSRDAGVFGTFVTYALRRGDKLLRVQNLHLLAEAVRP